jgi:hypothetical protein
VIRRRTSKEESTVNVARSTGRIRQARGWQNWLKESGEVSKLQAGAVRTNRGKAVRPSKASRIVGKGVGI